MRKHCAAAFLAALLAASGLATAAAANKPVASDEEFPVYFIAENTGADGVITAEAYEGDTLLASQLVSVEGGSFAVVTMYLTLEGAGEHVITVGDSSLTVTVE